MDQRYSFAHWAAPFAWAALAVTLVRVGRADPVLAAAAAAVALLGLGAVRTVAGSRGGTAGRLGELVLLGGAVGWALAEPAAHRSMVALATTLAAGGLAMLGVWPHASAEARLKLAALAGAGIGVVVATGTVGAPAWPVKALFMVAAAALTAALLARTAGPLMAVAATAGLGVAVGPAHVAAWLLPPLTAGALLALARGKGWPAAAAGVAAAALPPAGLALGAGLIVAGARRRRSPLPLLLAAPALLVAWWRLPAGVALVTGWSWSALAAALPLATTAMVFLLPAAALGLAARAGDAGDARDALGTGLLLVPVLGSGPWASAVAACLWLTALPAARRVDRHAVAATVPWTLGAAGVLLLTSPWGGVAAPAPAPAWLTAGWAVALVATFLPWRVARVAWLLPALALAWTVPVEGGDRRVAAGEELRLPAPPGAGWAFQVRCEDPATAGAPVLATVAGDMGPLRAGRDAPLAGAPARHPLLTSGGRGRHARSRASGVSSRRTAGSVTLRAATRVTVRWEPLERWRRRRRRFAGLVAGALLLLALGLWANSGRHRTTDAGLTVGLAAAVAAGSGVAVIARPAFRGAADLAAIVFLAALAALWPAVRRRRLAAGLLFLAPLALAQPLLRHPAGDEVYHLELAESLVHDGDLDITNNIDAAVPSEAVYLREGSRLIHSPALALLALPGFLLLGHGGALLLTAFLVAAAAALAARRARELGVSERAANWAWALTLASCPAITFATQLWPAAAGMAAAAALLWAAARPAPLWAVATTVASMLVKVRLGLITAPIALATAYRRRRPVWAVAVLGAGVAAAAVIAAILGGPLGRHRLVELLPASPAAMLTAAWGLLWDPAGGLAFAAPLWLVALAGLAAVWRKGGPGERALLLGGALTVALLLPRGEWYGGGSPPGRYLAPLAPLVLLGLAFLARKRRGRRLIRLALPWAAVASWVALTRPLWWFNPVDGGWWLADRISRGLGVAARRVFPSLLRPSPAVLLVPLLLLGLAWWWSRRPRAGAAAVSLVLFAGSVGLAAGAPEARVDAEDPQVRHLGGSAEPPPGTFFRAAGGISWRLGPGDAVELPWNPSQGEQPVARVRLLKGEKGALLAGWRNGPTATRIAVRGKRWRRVRLPYADGFGRSVLRLEWSGGSGSALLIDRVEAGR